MSNPADGRARQAAWAEPTAELVAPGVHRVPLPLPTDGLHAVNVYVLETESGLTLVDGGWAIAAARRQLEVSLRSIGHHPRDIGSFLVTHAHRDHYTQAAAIRSEFGRATVFLGSGERSNIESCTGAGEMPYVSRLRACGAAEEARGWEQWAEANQPDPADWQEPDRWISGDCTIEVGSRSLRAVPTPGHTAGHVVFADLEAGILFAGDHVLPTITPSVGFEAAGGELPLADYLESLALVRTLPDLQLLPAHGPVTSSTHARVDELLAHHETRLSATLEVARAGASSPKEVAVSLPWTRHERTYRELDTFNAGMAVMESKVHLDVLAARGELECRLVDGEWRYEVVSRGAVGCPRPRQ